MATVIVTVTIKRQSSKNEVITNSDKIEMELSLKTNSAKTMDGPCTKLPSVYVGGVLVTS